MRIGLHAPTGAQRAARARDCRPGGSFFTAVQEQLGLELDAQHAPGEVFVIDSAEPLWSANITSAC